jgi:hypothetical protein
MPLDELTDDQLDRQLRELLPPAPRSRSWERTQREALLHYITTGQTKTPHEPVLHNGESIGEVFALDPVRTASSQRRRWLLPTSAAAAVALVGGLIVVQQRSTETPAPAQAPDASLEVPLPNVADTVPALPAGAVEPDRFGVVGDPWPDADTATAEWGTLLGSDAATAEALIARPVDTSLRDAVVLTVRPSDQFDGAAGQPEQRTVAGLDVVVYIEPGTPPITTVVLPGTPALMVSGQNPIAFLEAAGGFPIDGARVDDDGDATFAIGAMPDGYETIVEPTRRATNTVDAWTRASDGDGGDGIAVRVGVNDPRLAWAQVGELEQIVLDGDVGWLVEQNGIASVHWQASETTWASIVGASSRDDAITFAESVDLVDQETWTERYDVRRPDTATLTPVEPAAPASTIAGY